MAWWHAKRRALPPDVYMSINRENDMDPAAMESKRVVPKSIPKRTVCTLVPEASSEVDETVFGRFES